MADLPRIRAKDPITKSDGSPTNGFVRFWETFCHFLETQEAGQNQTIADLSAIVSQLQSLTEATQQAQAAANTAQTSADTAGGATAQSGSAADPAIEIVGTDWITGPQVNLTGVGAGNLTITGSGPQQDGDVVLSGRRGSMVCSFRVVEVVSGVDTVVFTGAFTVYTDGPDTIASVVNTSASSVAAYSSARSSTGSVSYRIDAKGTGARTVESLQLYIFVRRA